MQPDSTVLQRQDSFRLTSTDKKENKYFPRFAFLKISKKRTMKLKGGVIIIGSLIWEDNLNNEAKDNIRKKWREQNLLNKRILTKVPIRYGRESGQNRKETYTMVFSKSCENSLGQAIIIPFNHKLITFEGLERQAIALAIAEGIYKKNNQRLTSNWGSVGLLINPILKEKDFASYEFIQKKWTDIYHTYQDTFVANNYKTIEENDSSITQDGFLNIRWQSEMNELDLLIATPVIPKPNSLLRPDEIAKKMIDNNYKIYFQNNNKNKIKTHQDEQILEHLSNKKN